jgi:hypothetical protein
MQTDCNARPAHEINAAWKGPVLLASGTGSVVSEREQALPEPGRPVVDDGRHGLMVRSRQNDADGRIELAQLVDRTLELAEVEGRFRLPPLVRNPLVHVPLQYLSSRLDLIPKVKQPLPRHVIGTLARDEIKCRRPRDPARLRRSGRRGIPRHDRSPPALMNDTTFLAKEIGKRGSSPTGWRTG